MINWNAIYTISTREIHNHLCWHVAGFHCTKTIIINCWGACDENCTIVLPAFCFNTSTHRLSCDTIFSVSSARFRKWAILSSSDFPSAMPLPNDVTTLISRAFVTWSEMELLGRERSRERSGSTIMEDFELIKTLDSSRQDEVSEVTAIMKDMLANYKEPWLLNTLVDYYFQTGSSGALEILKSIKQIQAQVRVNDIKVFVWEKLREKLRQISNVYRYYCSWRFPYWIIKGTYIAKLFYILAK